MNAEKVIENDDEIDRLRTMVETYNELLVDTKDGVYVVNFYTLTGINPVTLVGTVKVVLSE